MSEYTDAIGQYNRISRMMRDCALEGLGEEGWAEVRKALGAAADVMDEMSRRRKDDRPHRRSGEGRRLGVEADPRDRGESRVRADLFDRPVGQQEAPRIGPPGAHREVRGGRAQRPRAPPQGDMEAQGMTEVVVKAYRYKGRKYLGPDGYTWKVIGVAFVDDRVYVWLRRTWRPFSRKFRYAVAHGDGAITWVMEGADMLAARIEKRRRKG